MLDSLHEQFGEAIEAAEQVGGELRVRISPTSLAAVCQFCKGKGYYYLADVTAVDTGREVRLVYRLISLATNGHVVITVGLPRSGARVASICAVYRGAEWPEREVYDLFGVRFDGHPDLRRLLLTDDWQGYPLLKESH